MTHHNAISLMDSRKRQEVEFHNQRERDRLNLTDEAFKNKYSNKKWYSITRKSANYWLNWVTQNCHGKIALDYCCGLGEVSLKLAENGAFVHGIDISNESVQTAQKLLAGHGLAEKSKFQIMDAEHLTFNDDTFDIIICAGVLHHLDLNMAYTQLARVIKPTGKILCIEAMGSNPLIHFYRKRTPHLRTKWEAEHILTVAEVNQAREYFEEVRISYFHLLSIGAVLFRKTAIFSPILSFLESIDDVILKIPLIRLLAWQMIFELRRPKKG